MYIFGSSIIIILLSQYLVIEYYIYSFFLGLLYLIFCRFMSSKYLIVRVYNVVGTYIKCVINELFKFIIFLFILIKLKFDFGGNRLEWLLSYSIPTYCSKCMTNFITIYVTYVVVQYYIIEYSNKRVLLTKLCLYYKDV